MKCFSIVALRHFWSGCFHKEAGGKSKLKDVTLFDSSFMLGWAVILCADATRLTVVSLILERASVALPGQCCKNKVQEKYKESHR